MNLQLNNNKLMKSMDRNYNLMTYFLKGLFAALVTYVA